jgi:hypothetical protein
LIFLPFEVLQQLSDGGGDAFLGVFEVVELAAEELVVGG